MSVMTRNFEFEGHGVRVIERDDAPWFALVDVCAVLEIANSRNAAARLDDDEKALHGTDSLGRGNQLTIINESGLYSLILTSRKEEAKRFKKWVTGDVLPSIRKTGMYVMDGLERDEDLPTLADGKLFGVRVAKVNAAARMISVVNSIYGPEAARKLYESEPGLPDISNLAVGKLTGTVGDDPVGCFKHLCRVPVSNNVTLGAKLRVALGDSVAAKALASIGIRISPHQAPNCIAIADKGRFLAVAFAETQWQGEWRTALLKLRSARPSQSVLTFGDQQSKATYIDKSEVLELLPN